MSDLQDVIEILKHLGGKHSQSSHAPKSGRTAPKGGGNKQLINQNKFSELTGRGIGKETLKIGSTEQRLGMSIPEGKVKKDWERGLITEQELAQRLGVEKVYTDNIAKEVRSQDPGLSGFLRAEATLTGVSSRKQGESSHDKFGTMTDRELNSWAKLYNHGLAASSGDGVRLIDLGRKVGNSEYIRP